MKTIDRTTNPKLDSSVLILSLKKQHYLDTYQEPMVGKYSCFGYYDAIDIHFPERTSSLFQKKSNIQISPIWYGMGELIESQTGRFSQQNIGLFSIIDQDCPAADFYTRFWGEHSDSPYFAVGFIRLKEILDYVNVANELMQLSTSNSDPYVTVVVYYTYDNTDLVVLLRGNSISMISKVLREIEHNRSVYYMHSIFGISENYLKECQRQANGEIAIPSKWHGIDCHTNEPISEVEMRVSVSGGIFNEAMVRAFFEKDIGDLEGLENATVAYMYGHESLCIRIPKTNVNGVICLISEQGFCTHESRLYGNGILNIETSIITQERKIQNLTPVDLPEASPQTELSTPWTKSLMAKYTNLMKLAWDNKHESLYSCFLGMHQTLNTLSQYEGFGMSKDIFYTLFPGFDMFDKHLEKDILKLYPQQPLDGTKTAEYFEELYDALMTKISIFTTSVNQIIYHTVHTDQVFLMVPGYAGASYSIPIRLCMFYLHLSGLIINALNDSGFIKPNSVNKYEYSVLFIPEMEERAKSDLLYFNQDDQENKDGIIVFNVSQRALYMPRHFIIILAHELAHYVGVFIREREKRRTCIIDMLSQAISDEILNWTEQEINESQYPDIFESIHSFFLKNYEEPIIKQCKKYLYRSRLGSIPSSKIGKPATDEEWLHADKLESELVENCNEFLTDNRKGLRNIITDIPENFVNELQSLYQENKDYTYVDFMIMVGKCQSMMLAKCESLLANDFVNNWLGLSIFPLYREIFSDVAAICLLKVDQQTYLETFNISEGCSRDTVIYTGPNTEGAAKLSQSPLDLFRYYIINSIFFDSKPDNPKDSGKTDDQSGASLMPDFWKNNLSSYAKACMDSINQYLDSDPEAKDSAERLREIFALFLNAEQSKSEIYNIIVNSIKSFQEKTEKEYKTRCSGLRDNGGDIQPG